MPTQATGPASSVMPRPPLLGQAGALTEDAVQSMMLAFGYGQPILYTSSGAINPNLQQRGMITASSIAALTLVAPLSGNWDVGGHDFLTIELISTTAFAHTLTATNLLCTGATGKSIATFANKAGAKLKLMAFGGLWYVIDQIQITFS